jgi:hypothetical protein
VYCIFDSLSVQKNKRGSEKAVIEICGVEIIFAVSFKVTPNAIDDFSIMENTEL